MQTAHNVHKDNDCRGVEERRLIVIPGQTGVLCINRGKLEGRYKDHFQQAQGQGIEVGQYCQNPSLVVYSDATE